MITERRDGKVFSTDLREDDYLDPSAMSRATETVTGKDSLVQQQFADEVDVNNIMRRFGVTREMPFGVAQGVFGDFSGISDYDSAVARIEDAQKRFMMLPADVRDYFQNDPGAMVRAAHEMSADDFADVFRPRGGGVEPPPVVDT